MKNRVGKEEYYKRKGADIQVIENQKRVGINWKENLVTTDCGKCSYKNMIEY